MEKKRVTTDAVEILHRRIYEGHPKRLAGLAEAEADLDVAMKIYEIRTKAGLTQKELAKMIGTTPSVISRLEDADYQGHSLAMLRRIAEAMGKRVEIRFVTIKSDKKTKSKGKK
jgi:ribosome-binding protein aMBF1 (putative translation factor)